ncbi:MAG: Fe-Mn family superoxide dismutase [Bacilli bacterium]
MISKKVFEFKNNVMSKKAFDNHYSLYLGYINKLNEVDMNLKIPNFNNNFYRGTKLEETYSLDSIILHELYFENMSNIKNNIGPKTKIILEDKYKNYNDFVEDLKKCGMNSRGWAVLGYNNRDQSIRMYMLDEHNKGVVLNIIPILVLDVYEHAYYIDYEKDKNAYINNFINNINWGVIEKRIGSLFLR